MDWSNLLTWLPMAQYGGGVGGPGWGPGMMFYGYGHSWVGFAMMILFWGLIILGAVALIRWLSQGGRGGSPDSKGGSSALDILKERYARGELSKEEFENMKRDIAS